LDTPLRFTARAVIFCVPPFFPLRYHDSRPSALIACPTYVRVRDLILFIIPPPFVEYYLGSPTSYSVVRCPPLPDRFPSRRSRVDGLVDSRDILAIRRKPGALLRTIVIKVLCDEYRGSSHVGVRPVWVNWRSPPPAFSGYFVWRTKPLSVRRPDSESKSPKVHSFCQQM